MIPYEATHCCDDGSSPGTPFSFYCHLPFPITKKKPLLKYLINWNPGGKNLTLSSRKSDTSNRKVTSELRVFISSLLDDIKSFVVISSYLTCPPHHSKTVPIKSNIIPFIHKSIYYKQLNFCTLKRQTFSFAR